MSLEGYQSYYHQKQSYSQYTGFLATEFARVLEVSCIPHQLPVKNEKSIIHSRENVFECIARLLTIDVGQRLHISFSVLKIDDYIALYTSSK